jgi:hypothetical protein
MVHGIWLEKTSRMHGGVLCTSLGAGTGLAGNVGDVGDTRHCRQISPTWGVFADRATVCALTRVDLACRRAILFYLAYFPRIYAYAK